KASAELEIVPLTKYPSFVAAPMLRSITTTTVNSSSSPKLRLSLSLTTTGPYSTGFPLSVSFEKQLAERKTEGGEVKGCVCSSRTSQGDSLSTRYRKRR